MGRTAAATAVAAIKIKAKAEVEAIVAAAAAAEARDEERVAADDHGVEEKMIVKVIENVGVEIAEVIENAGVAREDGVAELNVRMATEGDDVAAGVVTENVVPQVRDGGGGAVKENVLDLTVAVQAADAVMRSVTGGAQRNALAPMQAAVVVTGLAQRIRTVVNSGTTREHRKTAEAAVRLKRNLEKMKKVASRAAALVVMVVMPKGSRNVKLCRKQLPRA
mmetsp:Transcript_56152/g.87439  ORF Transcript_56152/g.87439 Transcript_56152/m.87439 type:complete len:221 (-) Transcript_56152:516-1178(-)